MILQPGDIVYDYSMARPTDADFARVPGLKGVCRYLSPLNSDGSYYGPAAAKMITIDEYRWHLSQGRVVIKNYEWYEGRMGEGAPAGKQDAYWAATLAWRLDQAAGVTPDGISKHIIFSDDTGGTPYSAVKAYLLAAYAQMQGMSGKYLPTYYGREWIIRQLLADPDITWDIGYVIWQTGAWSDCQHGGTAPLFQAICWPERIDEQIGGCDVNIVKKAIGSDDDMTQPQVDDIKAAISAAVDNINQHVNADRAEAKVLTAGAIGAVNAAADNVNQHVNAAREQNVAIIAMLTALAAGQVTAADVAAALLPQLTAAILAGLPSGSTVTEEQIREIADQVIGKIADLLSKPEQPA